MPTASDTAPPVRPVDRLADRLLDAGEVHRSHLRALERQVRVLPRAAR